MFNLTFTGSSNDAELGKIELNGLCEYFSTTFVYWGASRYQRQWLDAINRIKSGKGTSAFITSITDPKNSNFISWWVCYEKNENLIFQEHLLFLEELEVPFNEKEPYSSIYEYEEFCEEGERISSWCCSKSDVIEFGTLLEKNRT